MGERTGRWIVSTAFQSCQRQKWVAERGREWYSTGASRPASTLAAFLADLPALVTERSGGGFAKPLVLHSDWRLVTAICFKQHLYGKTWPSYCRHTYCHLYVMSGYVTTMPHGVAVCDTSASKRSGRRCRPTGLGGRRIAHPARGRRSARAGVAIVDRRDGRFQTARRP